MPAVVVGSLHSSRSNGFWLRRLITGVVLLSGVKYVGGSPDLLGACALAIALLLGLLALSQWSKVRRATSQAVDSVAEAIEDIVAPLPARLDGDL